MIGEEVGKRIEQEAGANDHSYSASFTEEGDGIVQWQLYGRHGRGLAICLDFESLQRSHNEVESVDPKSGDFTAPHFFLHRIEYDRNTQNQQIEQLLDAALNCWPDALHEYPVEPAEKVARQVSFYLSLLVNWTFKHSVYVHEREWKATPNVAGVEFVRFHATKTTMRPYMEMAFDPHCIREVVVGSSLLFEDAQRVIRLFFQRHGIADVVIRRSNVLLTPYDD